MSYPSTISFKLNPMDPQAATPTTPIATSNNDPAVANPLPHSSHLGGAPELGETERLEKVKDGRDTAAAEMVLDRDLSGFLSEKHGVGVVGESAQEELDAGKPTGQHSKEDVNHAWRMAGPEDLLFSGYDVSIYM